MPVDAYAGRQATGRLLLGQELPGLAQKNFELVMLQPVAGLVNLDDASIGDFLGQGIGFRILGKTLASPEKQRRTGNLAQDLGGFLQVRALGRKHPGVVVEFPDDGTVGVPVGAMQGQVLGHLIR
jgi:hypothetical protein